MTSKHTPALTGVCESLNTLTDLANSDAISLKEAANIAQDLRVELEGIKELWEAPAMLDALRALSEQFERFAPFDSQAEIEAADTASAILAKIDGGDNDQ